MRKLYISIFTLFFSLNVFAQADLQNGMVGYYPFNNNANDLSGGGNNGTINGATLTTDRFGNPNSAYSFNGTSNYISIPVSNFLLDNFTYSVWVYVDDIPGINEAASIITIGQAHGDQGIFLVNEYPSDFSQTGFLAAGNNSSTTNSSCYAGFLPPTSQWYHLAMVRSSTEMKLFINGTLIKTTTVPNAAYYGEGSAQKAIIGARSHGDMHYFNGKIDEVKIYNRALSDCEISVLALDTSTESLIASYPFTGNADDASDNSNDGTVNGATLTTDRLGNENSAYSFDGISNNIELPIENLLLDNYTYSVWVNPNAIPSSGNAASILTIGQIAGDQGIFLGNSYNNANTGFFISGYNSSTTNSSCQTGTLPSTSTWYHIVMIRNSTELKLYVNGALINTSEVPNAAYYGSGSSPKAIIGARSHGNMQYFNGKIDDIKIYTRGLLDCEVTALYNEEKVVTSNLSPALNEAVKLYPNPTEGKLSIEYPASFGSSNVTLHNSLGAIVYTGNMNTSQIIELNNLPSGIYILKLRTEEGKEMNRKVIIK